MIKGVQIISLTQIPDERGKVMHMLRNDDPHFEQFGEIYFSCVYPGKFKGWHLHSLMTLNYTCIVGNIKLSLKTNDNDVWDIFIGESNYSLVIIPPNIWNGFTGLGTSMSIVANCASHPHDPNEIIRRNG